MLFFEHKLLYLSEGPVPLEDDVAPFGVARVVREEGRHRRRALVHGAGGARGGRAARRGKASTSR
ncbi:MAG: hypothetical protein M5U28_54395 [Sandaracinaceae bacterium]|nr:hypothetical protein [Sandaracinaceae bacterium]